MARLAELMPAEEPGEGSNTTARGAVCIGGDTDVGYWGRWYAAQEGATEWHVRHRALRSVVMPHLLRAAEGSGVGGPHIVDIGCGTSTWGLDVLQDIGGRLMLVDAVASLIEVLRQRYAEDTRIECAVADCRRLGDLDLADGAASIVLDKGTLDALVSAEDQLTTLRGVARLLRRPSGVFISVSFATAARVLLLRRAARELGLQLRIRAVPAEPEVRLVAVLGESLLGAEAEEPEDELTKMKLDALLFSGPLRGEQFICFEHPALPGTITVEQERPASRTGQDEDVTGCIVWPAAHALSAHLCAHPELVRGHRVVELGAGTGLVGLVAAALGAREVVLSDLPSTLPLLRANAARNGALCGGRARAAELRWGQEVGSDLAGCEVVIGCEIVYQHDEETAAALVETLRRLLAGEEGGTAGHADSGTCLIAYEFRDGMLGDMHFFDRVNKLFDVEVVSLGPYGFGVPVGEDDQSRLLYVYRLHRNGARGST